MQQSEDAGNRHTEEKKVELNQLTGSLGEGLCAKATAAIKMIGEHAGTHKVFMIRIRGGLQTKGLYV